MNKTLKKIAVSCLLSGVLFSGSIVGYNSLAINNYYHNVDNNYSVQNKWNESIDNYKLLSDNFKKYSYSEADFKRDKDFFNELYTPEYYKEGYDKQFRKGYAFNSELSILEYLSISLLYQNYTKDLLNFKSMTKTMAESKKNQYQKVLDFNRYILNKNHKEFSGTQASMRIYLQYNPNMMVKINNFNKLLTDNKLPPLFPNEEHQIETLKLKDAAIGNDDLYYNMLITQGKDYMTFVKSIKNNELTKEQEYNFFKTMSYTKYLFSQRANINEEARISSYQVYNSSNNVFRSTIDLLTNKTTINKDLREKNGIGEDIL